MRKRTIVIVIAIASIFFVAAHFYNKWHINNVKSKPQKYSYIYYKGLNKPVSVLIISDLDYKEAYIDYYKRIESGDNSASLPNDFPIKGLPLYTPIFVMKYSDDSVLAKVVGLYDNPLALGGNYTEGWVYAATLHDAPPPRDSASK